MSDEPTPKDNGTEWSMAEPVFRSTEGHTPKSVVGSDAAEIDTEIPPFDESDDDDLDTESPDLEEIETGEPQSDAAVETPANIAKPKRGCAKSFLMIVGLIVFVAVAVIIAAVYFLFYFNPAPSGTF